MQVSDRRVSILAPFTIRNGHLFREYIPLDDNTNKAIWWNGRIALSYTGLASIAGMRTDVWITKTLAKFPTFQEGIEGLQNEATSYFQKYEPYHPQQGFLAFVGMGWSDKSSELQGLPFLFLISNFHDALAKPLEFRQSKFIASFGTISDSQDVLLYVTGQPLFKHEYYGLTRYIRIALKKHASPQLILQLLAGTIRDVANHNSAVGKNLMMISLPKNKESPTIKLPNGQIGRIDLSGLPSKESPSFYYLSELDKPIEYGPNVASYGNYIKDFKYETVDGVETFSVIPGSLDLQ